MKSDSRDIDRDGYAVAIVVLVLALVAISATSLTQLMRTEALATSNSVQMRQAEALADAAWRRGLHALVNPQQPDDWKRDGSPYYFDFAGAQLAFAIEDESGKIDLNPEDDVLLRGLLEQAAAQIDGLSSARLADLIGDWRDPDELVRLSGAERDQYFDAGADYGPPNRGFRAIGELHQLLDVDPALYAWLAPNVTVYNAAGRIDPKVAPAKVLQAVPGITSNQAESYVDERNARRFANPASDPVPPTGEGEWLGAGEKRIFTIYGGALLQSGVAAARRVVIWLPDPSDDNDGDAGVSALYRILEFDADAPPDRFFSRDGESDGGSEQP
ncbi:MAG: type II secretion system protein GspK [Parvularculaceae bacterium]